MTLSPPPREYGMLPEKMQGVLEMGAKAIVHRGAWKVQVNLKGKSRIITRLRDFVRNKDYPDKQVAEVVAEIINTQVLVGNFKWDTWFPQDRKQYKFKLIAATWLDEPHKPGTDYQYRLTMRKHILPVMGETDVRDLHRPDFHWIRKTHSDTPKAQNIRAVCQNFLTWCYNEEIREHPIKLPAIKVPRKGLPYISRKMRERIQAAVSPEYQGATLLSLRMGLRAAEIAALEWEDVEEQGITIRHNLSYYQKTTPKEGGSRFSPYQGEVKETLEGLRKELVAAGKLPVGLVFRLNSGSRMWPNLISNQWSKAAKAVGVAMRMHENRHSLGQDMLEEGLSITQVQAILGHKSVRTTETSYARHNKGGLVKIVEARLRHNKARKALS